MATNTFICSRTGSVFPAGSHAGYISHKSQSSHSSLPNITNTIESDSKVMRSNSTRSTRRPLPIAPAASSKPLPMQRNISVRRLPAPPVPSPLSSAQHPTSARPLPPRPLVPESPPCYSDDTAITVTFRDEEKALRITKPEIALTKPQMNIITDFDSLHISLQSSVLVTPVSPSIPHAPTPTTARRKRMSKLRRHLGESVPDELVLKPASVPRLPSQIMQRLATVETLTTDSDEVELCFKRTKFMNSLESLSSGSVGTISDDEHSEFDIVEEEDGDALPETREEFSWSKDMNMTYNVVPPKRYSKRWILEKGGQRVEDIDYEDILMRLRSL